MQTIVFDLDGTLAEISHRRKYLDYKKPSWRLFNYHMGDDTVNVPVAALYRTLWNTGEYEMIIVSGRNERYRRLTEQWLVWNHIPFGRLLMRPDRDNRADYLLKEQILHELRAEGKDILFTVDDRQQVVNMWRRNGVTCLQCDYGDF